MSGMAGIGFWRGRRVLAVVVVVSAVACAWAWADRLLVLLVRSERRPRC